MGKSSGVAVLDKAALLLDAAADGPLTFAGLVRRSGLPRATAHRLAVALEVHGLLERDGSGRWRTGGRLAPADRLLASAQPVLERLRDATGESAQLYRRVGRQRVCIAAAENASGLRDTVPVGARLPMTAGSAAQVLLAWSGEPLPSGARFDAGGLEGVRRQGWAVSVGEREPGVASVSAPVRDADGEVVAAVSVSGPVERLGRDPGPSYAEAVLAAAAELSTG